MSQLWDRFRAHIRARTIFALIIGIDQYSADDLPDLDGAVNDAKEFKKFLAAPREAPKSDERGLGVPETQIKLLVNKQATRAAILSAFETHLLRNRSITQHDTMIFYFAGHGSRTEAPRNKLAEVAPDRKLEVICPADERTRDAAGYVHAIPDYILGWLLRRLAHKKGPHIAVILDSCHSGGMDRDGGKARAAKTESNHIPPDLDRHLWKGSTKETVHSHRMWSSATSHVLLAACGADETARETMYSDAGGRLHGRFTWSLLRALRRVPLSNTTYADLREHLGEWPGQTPYCVGSNRDTLVFDGNYPNTGRQARKLQVERDSAGDESYWVQMGTMEGVITGTEFSVIPPDRKKVLCTLVAHSVRSDRTDLVQKTSSSRKKLISRPQSIPTGASVMVSRWPEKSAMILRIYTPPDFEFTSALFPTTKNSDQPFARKFVEAESPERADIHMRYLRWHTSKPMSDVPCAIPDGDRPSSYLAAAVNGVAHFKYFLQVRGIDLPAPAAGLEMHRLVGEWPTRERSGGNMIRNGKAHFSADANAVRLHAEKHIRYVSLPVSTLFQPEDYTIHLWYPLPGAQHKLLRRGEAVALGMGGEPGFEFSIPPGRTQSSGFFKIFASTKDTNHSQIQQKRLGLSQEVIERWGAYNPIMITMTSAQ
ncbi:caspase domain-containing protein [Mycena leptocephala]|nr:caspase domain-containing protein [Mycena leptocephala]